MRFRTSVVLAAALMVLSGGAMAQNEQAVRKALAPLYAKVRQAFLHRDVDAFIAILAPSGTARQGEKASDPQEVRVQVGMRLAMLKKMTTVKMEMQKVTVNGDRAVVMNRFEYEGIVETQPGKTVRMGDKGITRDTWARTPKGWRLLHIETVQSNPTMDGKPLIEAMKQNSAPQSGSKPTGKPR